MVLLSGELLSIFSNSAFFPAKTLVFFSSCHKDLTLAQKHVSIRSDSGLRPHVPAAQAGRAPPLRCFLRSSLSHHRRPTGARAEASKGRWDTVPTISWLSACRLSSPIPGHHRTFMIYSRGGLSRQLISLLCTASFSEAKSPPMWGGGVKKGLVRSLRRPTPSQSLTETQARGLFQSQCNCRTHPCQILWVECSRSPI